MCVCIYICVCVCVCVCESKNNLSIKEKVNFCSLTHRILAKTKTDSTFFFFFGKQPEKISPQVVKECLLYSPI